MLRAIYGTRARQYSSISNYIAQFRPQKSKLRFFHSSIIFSPEVYTMFLSHCCFQPLTQPYDPWLLLCDSLLKNRAANIPFWKWCKVKSWGLYRNRLQKPKNGAGEAMQPPKTNFSKKKSTILPTKYSAFWWRIPGSNRWPLACHASALPAELIPHKFQKQASGMENL